ncbi:hypothetical protein D1871_04555 [Nakamurella silvestris]|nr:hypothetical protein D1871_04555 [Nakamurella silvestris]
MITLAETAVHHDSTWNGTNWTIALGGFVVLAIIATAGMWVLYDPDETRYDQPFKNPGRLIALAVVAALAAAVVHSIIARHIPSNGGIFVWILIPLLPALVCVWALGRSGSTVAIPAWCVAGIFTAGTILTGISEALTRLAASIPMSVGGVVVVLAVAVLWGIQKARQT